MANNAAAAQEDAAIPIIDVGALVNDDATPDEVQHVVASDSPVTHTHYQIAPPVVKMAQNRIRDVFLLSDTSTCGAGGPKHVSNPTHRTLNTILFIYWSY